MPAYTLLVSRDAYKSREGCERTNTERRKKEAEVRRVGDEINTDKMILEIIREGNRGISRRGMKISWSRWRRNFARRSGTAKLPMYQMLLEPVSGSILRRFLRWFLSSERTYESMVTYYLSFFFSFSWKWLNFYNFELYIF